MKHAHVSYRLALALCISAAAWVGCSADATQDATPSADPNGVAPKVPAESDDDGGETDDGSDAGERVTDGGKKDAGKDAGKKADAAVADAGDDDWPFGSSDAAAKDAATTDAASAACNTVPVAVVTQKAITGSAPTMTGGTPADGTYHLVSSSRYINGTSGTTLPSKGAGIRIAGTTLDMKLTGFGITKTASYTFTVQGSKLKLTRTCPTAGSEEWSFTAAGNTLTIQGLGVSNDWYDVLEK